MTDSSKTFEVNHVISLYDYDKETIIFSLDIEFDGQIDEVDFSNELLKISTECKMLPLNTTFYKIIKLNGSEYYLDFN